MGFASQQECLRQIVKVSRTNIITMTQRPIGLRVGHAAVLWVSGLSNVGRRKQLEVQIAFWPHLHDVARRLPNCKGLPGKEFQGGRPAWWPVLGSETEVV